MTISEIEKTLKTMSIIVDTREKKWGHIKTFLDVQKCPYVERKLDYGDYSCTYINADGEPCTMPKNVVIERKASLDELAGNITKGRDRFRREFERAKSDNAKVYLLIENASYMDILSHSYRSKLDPNAYLATLFSWQEEFDFTISFVPKELSGKYIKGTLFYALKKQLLMECGG